VERFRASELFEELGENSHVAMTLNNFANLLRQTDRLAEAELIFQGAREINEKNDKTE
jgi:hypothetical protein